MKKFPKTIYVQWDGSDKEPFLTADETVPSPDETAPCAVYQLVEVGEVEVTRKLVTKKARK